MSLRKSSWSRWDRIRQRVIRRASGLCEICLRDGRVTEGREVDHIVPIKDGGTDDDDEVDPDDLTEEQAQQVTDAVAAALEDDDAGDES